MLPVVDILIYSDYERVSLKRPIVFVGRKTNAKYLKETYNICDVMVLVIQMVKMKTIMMTNGEENNKELKMSCTEYSLT